MEPSTTSTSSNTNNNEGTNKLQQKIENSLKRIAQLDDLVGNLEDKIAVMEEKVLLVVDDMELFDLQKEKERLEKQATKYLAEWDDLEEWLEENGVSSSSD